MIRKPKIKRRALPKPQMEPATQKMEANKEKEQSLKFLPPQANKAAHRIMMMARRRRPKHPAKKSDLCHWISEIKFE